MFLNKVIMLFLVFFTSLVLALPEDAKQPIEIEAYSVLVDEIKGFNEFSGNAEVRQGSLLLLAELIQVQTNNEEVVSVIAKGSLQKPAKYSQDQENQERFIEGTANLIRYDVNEGIIFLVGNAHLVQGFDSFSGDTLNYDIDNNRVFIKGSEDGTKDFSPKRVKFKIVL